MSGAGQCIVTHRDGKVYGVYGPYRTTATAAAARDELTRAIAGNEIGPNAAFIRPLSEPLTPRTSEHHMEATC